MVALGYKGIEDALVCASLDQLQLGAYGIELNVLLAPGRPEDG
jgi:hypothetical protein